MTNEKAIMCLEDMKIKVPIPKAAKQARENNEALDVAIKALQPAEPKRETTTLRIGRTRNSVTMWYECAECGEPVDQEDAFCRRCGRGIIHE